MKVLSILFALFFCASFTTMAKKVDAHEVFTQDTLKKGKNYILFAKTENISNVDFKKDKKGKENIVYIRFGYPTPIPSSNTISSNVITSKRYNEDSTAPIFDKIDILKGKYIDIEMSKDTKVRNLYKLTGVEFPLQLKLISGSESVQLEVTEAGEWNIGIELKNN